MNLDTVTRPMEKVRDEVLRLSETWVREGRTLSLKALHGSAAALTTTAQRLDALAERLNTPPTHTPETPVEGTVHATESTETSAEMHADTTPVVAEASEDTSTDNHASSSRKKSRKGGSLS